MINFIYANSFCCDDIALIENYEQAANDKKQTWDCHHRIGADLGLSKGELIERNLYYDRPASELIFLTHSDHMKLHRIDKQRSEESKKKQSTTMKEKFNNGCLSHQGEKNPMYGKKQSKESNRKRSENSPLKGTHPTWMNNGIIRVRPRTQEEIEHYRSLGYNFGKKLNNYITKNIT